jgi:hypothetical protein
MARIGEMPFEQSIAELDALDLRNASAFEIALWLNNRAYALAQTGSSGLALEHLVEAEELLEGEDAHLQDFLYSCIIGTRGIAQLHAGLLNDADANLERALALDLPAIDDADEHIAFNARHLTAERLWWLAVIAEKRGHQRLRLDRLEQAAQFRETKFGERARKALAGD